MRKVYVNLIGTDGSGKTTLSEMLTSALGDKSQMIWCGAESFLMKPIRSFLGLFTRTKQEHAANADYKWDLSKKQAIANKSSIMTCVYISLVLLDYKLQYLWKMWKVREAEYIVLDRYFFDVSVNIAIRLGWSPDELVKFIEKHMHKFHLPDLRVWVKVSPEVSMDRKDDIPDISYVQLRLDFYQKIADTFGFYQIDGTQPLETSESQLINYVENIRTKKHVMYVHSNNEDVGGADFCLFRLANEMKKRGMMVSCALRLESFVVDEYRQAGIPVFRKQFSRPQLSRGILSILLIPFKSFMDIIYFRKLFKNQKPNIVHVNDLYDFAPAMAAKTLGIPVFYHIRMIRVNSIETRVFAWLVGLVSYKSISVSTPVRDHYFSNPKYNIEKHIVIYDWPNDLLTDRINTLKKPKDFQPKGVSVVMVGRLEEWKGQHIFLEAVKDVIERVDHEVTFYLIGGTVIGADKESYAQGVMETASQLSNVHYLGARDDVPNILAYADISVHASTTPDPFPGVVLESLLSKAATVGVNAGGVAEMIRDGEDGFLFTPSNSKELAEKLISLINSEEIRRKFAESGRNRILQMTNKELLLKQFEMHYDNA